jgi:hypothetical protein
VISNIYDLLRATRLFGTGRRLLSAATQRMREQWVKLPPNIITPGHVAPRALKAGGSRVTSLT